MTSIGITTWVWTSPLTIESFGPLAAHIAEIGFDMVEVPIEAAGALDYSRISQIARDNGLAVSICGMLVPERDLLDSDERVRARGMAYVRHCVDAARTVGCPHVVGPFYSAVGRTWLSSDADRRRDVDLLVGELRELATYAGDNDVSICIEPLNRFETSFINTAAQAVDLVDRVEHDACGIVLDTFHMNIEERSMADAIRLVGPRLRHLQVSDNDRGTPGAGHIPWAEVAAACRDVGYDRAVVIETFSTQVEVIARAASIWRPLAPSQDALARDGLRFLRELFRP